MPGLSTLEKALMLGVPATVAGIAAAPEESEGASVGKSALDWAAKNWRKLNPEKTVSSFQMEEASKWAEDVPKKMGLKLSRAAENSDRSILLEALQHPDFPNLQASHINTLRAETAALPDAVHEAIKPEFKFLPSGTNPRLGGQFSYSPKTEKSVVKFNPSDEDRGVGVAGHELGSHGLQYPAQSEGLFKPEDLENIKLSRNVSKEYATIGGNIPAFPGSYSSLSPQELELAQKKFRYYYNKPTEIAARAMGKGVSNAVAAGGESLAGVRDLDSYLSEFNRVTKGSLAAAKHYDPDAYAAGLSKLALPLALGGGAIASVAATPTYASEQVMSNIDKTVQGGSRLRPEIDSERSIPAGDIGGDFSAGAAGAIDVIKGVAGATGGLVQRTSKSLGKVIDAVTGQRTARSKPLEGDDYERVINSAALFFNPSKMVGNTGLGIGFDWMNPSEAGAPELTPEMRR